MFSNSVDRKVLTLGEYAKRCKAMISSDGDSEDDHPLPFLKDVPIRSVSVASGCGLFSFFLLVHSHQDHRLEHVLCCRIQIQIIDRAQRIC